MGVIFDMIVREYVTWFSMRCIIFNKTSLFGFVGRLSGMRKMKTRALVDAMKREVVGMHKGGMESAHIAKELGMPFSTIYGVLEVLRTNKL